MTLLLRLTTFLSLAFLSACTNYSTYTPRPGIVMLRGDVKADAKTAEDSARVLVTLDGIQQAGDKHPGIINATIRIENLGLAPILFDERNVALLDARLVPLATPPGGTVAIEPGQAMLRSLGFALLPGQKLEDPSMSILNLRFTLALANKEFPHTMVFNRIDYYYYPTYYYGGYWYR